MDSTDLKILEILQSNGRISMKHLGERVALTPPAVTERVRRLEDTNVIESYKAVVNPINLGKLINAEVVKAIIRVEISSKYRKKFIELVEMEDAIVECHHLTGDDCMSITVLVENTLELKKLLQRIQLIGNTHTSIVLSSPIENKPIRFQEK